MKYVYKLAFTLVIGAGFALAQAGAGQSSQSSPAMPSSQQQTGAQTPDSSASAVTAQSDIQSALRKQLPASADNVMVSVTNDNKVQLSGTVNSASEKQQVEQIARSAAPNVEIVNNLHTSGSTAAPGTMPPASNEPSTSGKPPMLRLVAYQQSGNAGQDSPSTQTPGNPGSASPGQSGTQDPTSQTSGASGQTAGATSDVQDKIQKAIQQDSSLASSNINVNVADNKVELTGTVASKDQKKTARQIAEANAGGMKVVDHVKVSSTEATPSTPSTPPRN
jgi:osmotically-inducible protein OsmY